MTFINSKTMKTKSTNPNNFLSKKVLNIFVRFYSCEIPA